MGRTYFRLDHTRGGEIECCKWFSREVLASTDKHQRAAALTSFAIFYFVTRDDILLPVWWGPSWRARPWRCRTGRSTPAAAPGWSATTARPRTASPAQSPSSGCCARWTRPAGVTASNIFLLYQIFLKCLQYLWLMCEIFWRFFVGKIF